MRFFVREERRGLDDDPALYDLTMFAVVVPLGFLVILVVFTAVDRIAAAARWLRRLADTMAERLS